MGYGLFGNLNVFPVYEWVRRQYELRVDGEWHELESELEVMYITEDWRDTKTGSSEASFWLGIGATFDVEYDQFGDPIYVESVSPDGTRMFCETFEEHYIDASKLGWRECEALTESMYMRCIPVLEDTEEHVVIQFGDETKANYDLITGEWCG